MNSLRKAYEDPFHFDFIINNYIRISIIFKKLNYLIKNLNLLGYIFYKVLVVEVLEMLLYHCDFIEMSTILTILQIGFILYNTQSFLSM